MDAPILLLKKNNGVNLDISLFILDSPIIKIGRDSTSDFLIRDPYISRLQAEIYYEYEKWHIRDIQSKNGTFLNGKKVGSEPVTLKHGDVVSFSNMIEFLYQEGDWDESETRSITVQTSPYGIEMNENIQEVTVDGIKIKPGLGPQEWKFLSVLLGEPDRIHKYKDLAKEIYNVSDDYYIEKTYIKMLQGIKSDITEKLRKSGVTRTVIKSRNNEGYYLVLKTGSK